MVSENRGWIKKWRKCDENPLYFAEPFTKWQAWEDLILIAHFEDGLVNVRGNLMQVKRGQVAWAQDSLAKRWKWSRKKVVNFLKYLEKAHQTTQQKNPILGLITITNYNKYQEKEQQSEQQKNDRRTTEERQKNIEKNVKNVKNDNNITSENKLEIGQHPNSIIHRRWQAIKSAAKGYGIGLTFNSIQCDFLIHYSVQSIQEATHSCLAYIHSKGGQNMGYKYLHRMLQDYPIEKPITPDIPIKDQPQIEIKLNPLPRKHENTSGI